MRVTKAFHNLRFILFAVPSHAHQIHLPSITDLVEACYHGDAATPLALPAEGFALAVQLWDESRTTVHAAAMTS